MDVQLRGPIGIVRNYKVKQAVIVVVEPRCVHTECLVRLATNARFLRDVGECPISIVVVENISARTADEQVLIAVVVVISNGDAEVEVEVRSRQAGSCGDVLKRSVRLLMEQAVVERRVHLFQFRELRAVCEENVESAIVVEIENCDAPTHRLREVFPARQAVVRFVRDS